MFLFWDDPNISLDRSHPEDQLFVPGGLCGPRLLLREDGVVDVPVQSPL